MVGDHLAALSKGAAEALSCSLEERGCVVVLEPDQGAHASGVIGAGESI